jgi:thiol-disulfide isomerase/thioredoxin
MEILLVFSVQYAPWCVWCQRLHPTWEAFAEHVEEEKIPVRVVKVGDDDDDDDDGGGGGGGGGVVVNVRRRRRRRRMMMMVMMVMMMMMIPFPACGLRGERRAVPGAEGPRLVEHCA